MKKLPLSVALSGVHEFGTYRRFERPIHFVATPRTGDVTIEVFRGGDPTDPEAWQVYDQFNATTPQKDLCFNFEISGGYFRVTATGDATFIWRDE